MKRFGITGWKNAGKTTLTQRLVAEFTSRGLTVSTIKRTHHSVDLDPKGTDTHKHRTAGASEVLLASDARYAILKEHRDVPPSLDQLIARLAPVDLVLIEGFKSENHPKIEAHRAETAQGLIATNTPSVVAIATDTPVRLERDIPQFDLNNIPTIADFIARYLELDQ
ncbi:molybdopterin-guanine dinucleotide biosynthesis protein B [Cognatishimia sp.]|uniref:molybdopterin-guanine dinucleotide biosynthesis protein B n=1 Tax=Cognatishimia sp. TaxID=2211648 RepID=UPI003518CA8B